MKKDVTEQCLTIILPKKHMDIQYWPRLQKEGVFPYIRTDFKRWSWEGEQSDDLIIAMTDSHSPGTKNGPQVKISDQ
jgi:hypothetical protein